MRKNLFLFCILCLAFILRAVKLSDFPAGFTPDEAAQGYTAYSILKTGKDEWGVWLPLTPRSFGDFKSPLETYLIIPTIAIFGLNEFAVRLPNVILGTLAVLVVYFLVKELFGEGFSRIGKRISADTVALTASLFLAVSPWHVSLSRGAFEANLTTFFLPLAVLFFLYALRNPLFMILSSLFFGINLFTYHSAKLVTIMICIFLVIWKWNSLRSSWKKAKGFLAISGVVIVVLSLVAFSGLFFGGGTRASDIGIFSGGWEAVADRRYFAVINGLPDFLSRIFNNKLTFISEEFIKSYFSYLSPQFLFTHGAGEATYGMIPGRGVLFLAESPFILTALFFFLKGKNNGLRFFWLWVFVAPIPAAMARGVGYHANRVAVMMPAIQILSAYGAIELWQLIKVKFMRLNNLLLLFYSFTLLLSFTFFLESYFFQAPKVNAPTMSYGWKGAMDYLKRQNKKIIISRSLSEPQAFVMFWGKFDPSAVQLQTNAWMDYQKSGHFVDQLGKYSLGNYEFRNFFFPEDWQNINTILVGIEKDFWGQEKIISEKKIKGEIEEEKVINYPDGKLAFRIVKL